MKDIRSIYSSFIQKSIGERFAFLFKYYMTLIALSIVYKICFLIVCSNSNIAFADYCNVILHGLAHDIAVAGYFTTIPLLLTLVSVFLPVPMKRIIKWYNGIVAFIVALAFISDITLYPYWEFKLDASVLIYIDSPANAFASIALWEILLLAAVLALLTYGIYSLLGVSLRKNFGKFDNKATNSAFMILAGGLLFLGIRGGVTESTNNIGTVYYCNSKILNDAAVNPIFSFLYTVSNAEDFTDEYGFFDEEERESLFNGLYFQDTAITDTLLNTDRPNIITIVLEGMSAKLIEELGGKANITPNFNRLAQEGVLFTNCIANSYRTDRGLICTLSGYPSFPKTSVMKNAQKSQGLPSLALSLKYAGYDNTFLYGGDINFTNMKGYLLSTGYSTAYSDKDFTAAEQETHRWGAGDDITFNRLYDIVMEQQQSPWHITYLTLSSHEPWTVPYDRIESDEIANAFAFTDEELGKFITRLKENELWENTLVICISDHTLARYPTDAKETDIDRNRIPLLLIGGAVKESRRIDKLCNQTDLVATILAQLQLPVSDFTFSRNVLSPEYDYPFASHCFNNGISFIDSTGITIYNLDSQTTTHSAPAEGCEDRLRRAKAILQTTYSDFHSR